MAGKALLSLAAGFGTGYLGAQRQKELDDERKQDREIRLADAQLKLRQSQREEDQYNALADAGRTATVEPNITNDDDGNPTSAPSLRMVGPGPVRNFNDRGAADAAAATVNAEPVALRQASVLRSQGKPTDAIALENAVLSQQQLKQKAADDTLRRKVSEAMLKGWEGMTDLATTTEVGPFAGRKAAPIYSPDRKQVTIGVVGEDGSLQPTPLTFANDGSGLVQAAALFDRAITPEQRLKMHYDQRKDAREESKEQREGRKTEAEIVESGAKAGYYQSLGGAATVRAGAAAGKGEKAYKMDEDDKLRFQESGRRLSAAEKAVQDSLKDGAPADPVKNPAWANANQQAKAARRDHFVLQVKLGQIEPGDMATQMVGAANNFPEILKGLKQLADTVGTDFSDSVLAELAKTDKYQALKEADPASRAQSQNRPKARPAAAAPVALAAAPQAQPAAAPPPVSLAAAVPAGIDIGRLQKLKAKEDAEMGFGSRMQYSPEVKAFVQMQRDQQQQDSEAARAEQGRRAAAASRNLTLGSVLPK